MKLNELVFLYSTVILAILYLIGFVWVSFKGKLEEYGGLLFAFGAILLFLIALGIMRFNGA